MDWLCPSRTEHNAICSVLVIWQGQIKLVWHPSRKTQTCDAECSVQTHKDFGSDNDSSGITLYATLEYSFFSIIKRMLTKSSTRISKVLLIPFLILNSLNKNHFPQRRVEFCPVHNCSSVIEWSDELSDSSGASRYFGTSSPTSERQTKIDLY